MTSFSQIIYPFQFIIYTFATKSKQTENGTAYKNYARN